MHNEIFVVLWPSHGQPYLITVGTYQIIARADELQSAETDPFAVAEDEAFEFGDIALTGPPISISSIKTCDSLPPQGGTCRYSVTINNNTGTLLRGLAWSLVDGSGLGSSLDFTTFEASRGRGYRTARRQRVLARPFNVDEVSFQFEVPSFVRDGATFCTRLFFGLEPDPLVNTVRERQLFCITKGDFGFQVMSENESQKIFQSLSRRSPILRDVPTENP